MFPLFSRINSLRALVPRSSQAVALRNYADRISGKPAASKASIAHEKQKSLKGNVKSAVGPTAPGWNERLASASEANVKADHTPDKSMDELQRDTIESLLHDQDDAGSEKKAARSAFERAPGAFRKKESTSHRASR